MKSSTPNARKPTLVWTGGDPILITADKLVWQFFHELKHRCWFCEQPPNYYDWSVCFHRETWILYLGAHRKSAGLALACQAQAAGARKILLVTANRELFRR